MKVTMQPKYVDQTAETGNENNENQNSTALPVDESSKDALDAFFPDDSAVGDVVGIEDIPAEDAFFGFYGATTPASASDFNQAHVPSVTDILSDPALDIEMTEMMEFYDLLEQKYRNLKVQINESIDALKENMKINPAAASVYKQVIKQREEALKECNKQIESIKPLKASVEDVWAQELENLKNYGKEFHKWSKAYNEGGGEYTYVNADGDTVTEEATILNKPDPTDPKWGLMLDSDPHIGDTDLVIASKMTPVPSDLLDYVDSEFIETFDVLSTENKSRPIDFDADGNPLGVMSNKDVNYVGVISHENLSVVPESELEDYDIDADAVLKVDSTNAAVGNAGTPIDITVPSHFWVNSKGQAVGLVQDGNMITTAKPENTTDATLEKVVKITVLKADAIGSDDSGAKDHLIVLESANGKTFRIQVTTAKADIAASDLVVSFNAGHEDDPYSGAKMLNADFSSMKVNAENFNASKLIEYLTDAYGIVTPEKPDAYNAAMNQLKSGTMGVIAVGFEVLCAEGTTGNDFFALDEAKTEYNDSDEMVNDDTLPPLYTSALMGNGGFNAVFHKKGNLAVNDFNFIHGGQNDDHIFANVTHKVGDQNAVIYVNLNNENGTVEIGNKNDHPKGEEFGHEGDDAYIIAAEASNVAFSNPYDPDIQSVSKFREFWGEPPDVEHPADIDSSNWDDKKIADGIMDLTSEQINAQLEALKEQELDESDMDPLDYSDSNILHGEYENMKDEMDTFFAGWSSQFNPQLSFDMEEEEW